MHWAPLALKRAKRFAVALILVITALIDGVSLFCLSTTSLVKNIHTAHHVGQLSQMCQSLTTQEMIDRGLQDRLYALEAAALFMGNQIQNIKIRPSA